MPLKIVYGAKGSGLSLYLGELCPKCGEARLLHPQVYVYVCPYCRFSYQVNPVDRKKPITIISKSRFEK